MDYDRRDIPPEDYAKRVERPKRRRAIVFVSGLPPPSVDFRPNVRERNRVWRNDLPTEQHLTAKR